MQHWGVRDILEATQGCLLAHPSEIPSTGISIDTRALLPGQAYVALRGGRFDGNDFLDEAVRKGARCLIAERFSKPAEDYGVNVIRVPDGTLALGNLARYHRQRLQKNVIAITGSCGKTTTKEILAHLLGGEGPVLKSAGTQNNQIGVPLTLLRMEPSHRHAVVELGTNHPGEIASLAAIAEPDIAILTNVGPAHLEHFGSIMGVLKEKLSLFTALPQNGTAILPGDQLDVCLEAPRFLPSGCRRLTFGSNEGCDLRLQSVRAAAEGLSMQVEGHLGLWHLPLLGHHNAENALAAAACARALGMPVEQIRERLKTIPPPPLRSQFIRIAGLQIINDCYNANPLSCARALEMLRSLAVRRRVAVLGDMLELGSYTDSAHLAIGRMAARMGVDLLITVGDFASGIARGYQESSSGPTRHASCADEAAALLGRMLEPEDGILVKGSRRMGLERVAERLGASGAPQPAAV